MAQRGVCARVCVYVCVCVSRTLFNGGITSLSPHQKTLKVENVVSDTFGVFACAEPVPLSLGWWVLEYRFQAWLPGRAFGPTLAF